MSRFNLLIRGIGLGYVSQGFSIAYSLLSIPLALGFLGKSEYGLWALVLSITSYLNFSELGLTNSVQRHLIDVKDRRPNFEYGAIFLTGGVAFLFIGILCFLIGGVAVHFLSPLFRVPAPYASTFEWLLLGSVALFSLTIGTRILGVPLYVYQRHDLYEFSNIILYLIWFFVLWMGLHSGYGVFSLLLSQGIGFVWTCVFNLVVCLRYELYPKAEEWGLPSRQLFREVVVYSRDSFLQQLGQQVVMTLPMLLISRWLGLDAAAVWAVATRPYYILRQILGRPFRYGVSMLADIFANKGPDVMMKRWMALSQFMTAGAIILYPICIAYNGAFMAIWTHGKISWNFWNDIIYGIYSYLLVSLFPWYGIVGIDKKFGITRVTSILEAILLSLLCWVFYRPLGVSGFILSLILSKLAMGFLPSLYYLHGIFGKSIWPVFRSALVYPLTAAPPCILSVWLTREILPATSHWITFIIFVATQSIISTAFVLWIGLDRELKNEFLMKTKAFFSKILALRKSTLLENPE